MSHCHSRQSCRMMKTAVLCLVLTATLTGVTGRPGPASLQKVPRLELRNIDADRVTRVQYNSPRSIHKEHGNAAPLGSLTSSGAAVAGSPDAASSGTVQRSDRIGSRSKTATSTEAADTRTASDFPSSAGSGPQPAIRGTMTVSPQENLPPCSSSNSTDAVDGISWGPDDNTTSDGTLILHPPEYPCSASNGTQGSGNSTEPGVPPVASPSPEPLLPNLCEPKEYERADSQGVPIPPLGSDEKPNFIVILTDDQGWDDIGLHNPEWVNTPNLDKFIRSGTLFDNFYTSPQCAPSRAMVLTGRDYPRTGTLLVNAGYDSINSNEVTAGEFMSAAGYNTAQFGKWHNGQEMGYEPWNAGFKESWDVPISMVAHIDPIFVHNGEYVQTQGYLEEIMADKLITFMDSQAASGQPFFAYYATHSIHTGKLQYSGNYSAPWRGAGSEGDDEGFSGDNLQFESALMTNIGDDMSMNAPIKRGRSRPVPAEFRDKYYSDPKHASIADSTKDAWAALEYLDHGLGKIFDYLQTSPLRKNTYVMIGGDNGSALLDKGERSGKLLRMPGKMEGHKSLVLEGGIRNFWAVQGPGVEAGVVDNTLLNLADVLPTVVELARINHKKVDHPPWDGVSFANLLSGATKKNRIAAVAASLPARPRTESLDNFGSADTPMLPPGYRGTSLATPQQLDRFLISLGTQCWDFDAVPKLDANREVLRPQLLLGYDTGGQSHSLYRKQWNAWLPSSTPDNPGFQSCIAVRYGEYKWIGLTNKVYRFASNSSGSHIELPCNEVPEPEASHLAALMSSAARSWWSSVAASPHSFTKPTAYLGLGKWNVTNMLPQGAKERTPGHIQLLPNGATGFILPGDRMCFNIKVMRPGSYEVVFFYTAHADATFKLSVGNYADIVTESAPADWFILPAQRVLQGMSIGLFSLPKTPDKEKHEACLELVEGRSEPAAIFHLLANIQFTWTSPDMMYPLPQQPDDVDDQDDLMDPIPPIYPPDDVHEYPSDSGSDHPDDPGSAQDIEDAPDYTRPDVHSSGTRGQVKAPRARSAQHAAKTSVALSATAGFQPQESSRLQSNSDTVRGKKARGQQGVRAAGLRVAVPARGLDLSGKHSWLKASAPGAALRAPTIDDWTALRQKFGWPEGQRSMEAVWSPYDQEDIHDCPKCHPRI